MNNSVCSVVTSRSQYARVQTVLQELNDSPRIDFSLIVSGGALVHRFGELDEVIEKSGLNIDRKIHTLLEAGEPITQAKTTGLGLLEYATAFEEFDPDVLLISGDRYETMAVTLAASYLNIPVIHLEGGEITGSIDDKVRHATTKMSDYHFVSTARAKTLIEKLGEPAHRITRTGCPSIDLAKQIIENGQGRYDPQNDYGGVGDIVDTSSDYIVIQYHPVPTEYASNYVKTRELIEAYEQVDVQAFWFWPNMDAGTDQVSKALREYREHVDPDGVRFFISLDPIDYLTLVYNSKCMVGNSSVGIRECSYFGVPTVNIGGRQQNRERGPNVTDVECDADVIATTIENQLDNGRYERSEIYGSGNAAQQITKEIAAMDPTLKQPMTPEQLDIAGTHQTHVER